MTTSYNYYDILVTIGYWDQQLMHPCEHQRKDTKALCKLNSIGKLFVCSKIGYIT